MSEILIVYLYSVINSLRKLASIYNCFGWIIVIMALVAYENLKQGSLKDIKLGTKLIKISIVLFLGSLVLVVILPDRTYLDIIIKGLHYE